MSITKTGILVADGARARFLVFEPLDELERNTAAELVEHADLVNPDADLPEHQIYSDRGGRIHGAPGGSAHGAEAQREVREREMERRFVGRVLEEADRFAAEQSLSRMLIVAEPRWLGLLRPEMGSAHLRGIQIEELAEDLSRRTLSDLRAILGKHGLLPEARAPRGSVFHPRGQAPSAR